jgi:hypothetical protein
MIADMLAVAWSTPLAEQSQLSEHRMPKRIDPGSYSAGKLMDVASAECDNGWKMAQPDWSGIKGSMRPRFKDETLLSAVDVGAELTLRFKGTGIGIYVLAGPEAGSVESSIDGEPFRRVDLFHRFSKGLHYPRTVMLEADLERGPHELKLRIGEDRNRESSGNAVRILSFAVN